MRRGGSVFVRPQFDAPAQTVPALRPGKPDGRGTAAELTADLTTEILNQPPSARTRADEKNRAQGMGSGCRARVISDTGTALTSADA